MRPYDVYFEAFGKKMKTQILANSEEDAKQRLFDKIIWHKIVPVQENKSSTDILNDLMGFFNK